MANFDVLAQRPCGACAKYVPVAIGCRHWRPSASLAGGKNPPARKAKS